MWSWGKVVWTRAGVVEAVAGFYQVTGRFPTSEEYTKPSVVRPQIPSSRTVLQYYGRVAELHREIAGGWEERHRGHRRYTREDMVGMVRVWVEAHGGAVPGYQDYRCGGRAEPRLPTLKTVVERYWRSFKELNAEVVGEGE